MQSKKQKSHQLIQSSLLSHQSDNGNQNKEKNNHFRKDTPRDVVQDLGKRNKRVTITIKISMGEHVNENETTKAKAPI